MGVTPGKVQEIDARKGNQESTKQRESIDWVVRVESAEEDKGGTEGGGGERYVVEGVDTGTTVSKGQLLELRKPLTCWWESWQELC